MASHAALQQKPQVRGEKRDPVAPGFAPHGLERTAQLLNARPALAAQRALSEHLSAPRTPRTVQRAAPFGREAPVQRTLLYPQAEWDAGKTTIKEFTGSPNDLVNAAEPTQLEELAVSLNQAFVKYTPGAPPDLAGQRANYLVGHVAFTDAQTMLDPFWANLGPAAIVNDLVLGNIEAGSTLKILGCMGGVSLAPKIATLLAARGKLGVSVIASNDIVHATGQGIVSFPPHNPQPGGPMTDAYAARNRSSKDLGKQIVKWKKQLVPLQAQFAQLQENARLAIDGGADPDAVGAQLKLDRKPIWDKYYPILNAFVAAGGEHFDRVVGAFGAAHGGASHRTPQAQGWRKFVDNDTRQDLTAEDEHPDGRALPVVQQPPLQQPLAQQPQVVPHQGGAQQVPMIDATHNHPLMPGYVPDPVDASHNQPLM